MAEPVIFSSFRRPERLAAEPRQQPIQPDPPPIIEAPVPSAALHGAVHDEPIVPDPAPPPPAWADLSSIAVSCDQLGLAHPAIISLGAKLPGAPVVMLDAELAGIYQPAGSYPALKRDM